MYYVMTNYNLIIINFGLLYNKISVICDNFNAKISIKKYIYIYIVYNMTIAFSLQPFIIYSEK